MRTIARFMDARNTAEGKFLSVLLSVLLVFSFLNVTMFTDYAGADTTEEGNGTEIVTSLEDAEEPEAQPEDEADGPESEEPTEEVNEPATVIGTDDEVVSDDTTNDSSDELKASATDSLPAANEQQESPSAEREHATSAPLTQNALSLDKAQLLNDAGSLSVQVGKSDWLSGTSGSDHKWSADPSNVISLNAANSWCYVTGREAGSTVVTHTYYTGIGKKKVEHIETFTVTVTAATELAYFYFLLPGKDSTVNQSKTDYMYAGDGSITVPTGLGDRWYQGETHNGAKFDIGDYVVVPPTDEEIRRGLQAYYNGQDGRDTYNSEWTYTYEYLVMTTPRASVGYDYENLDPSSAYHVDIQLVIDKKDKASVGYRVLNPNGDVSTRSVEHQKNTTVEINSTVSETSSFTTDGAEYGPTKQYNGKTWYFDGWYTDDSYSTKADDSISVSEPTIFYARYVTHDNKLTYDAAGGEFGNGSSTVESYEASGAALTAHVAPTREGYNFEGWTGSDGLSYADGASFTMPDGNLILTAQWSAKTTESYTVKYLEKKRAKSWNPLRLGRIRPSERPTPRMPSELPAIPSIASRSPSLLLLPLRVKLSSTTRL